MSSHILYSDGHKSSKITFIKLNVLRVSRVNSSQPQLPLLYENPFFTIYVIAPSPQSTPQNTISTPSLYFPPFKPSPSSEKLPLLGLLFTSLLSWILYWYRTSGKVRPWFWSVRRSLTTSVVTLPSSLSDFLVVSSDILV